MKTTNIVKHHILMAISENIFMHTDLKERISRLVKVDFSRPAYDFVNVREKLLGFSSRLHFLFTHGGWHKELPFEIVDGSYFKEADHAADIPEIVKILDQLRIELGRDLNGLQETFTANIGKITDIDNIAAVLGFNDEFKLDGRNETDFASRIDVVYNQMYEKFDIDELSGNISPLIIK